MDEMRHWHNHQRRPQKVVTPQRHLSRVYFGRCLPYRGFILKLHLLELFGKYTRDAVKFTYILQLIRQICHDIGQDTQTVNSSELRATQRLCSTSKVTGSKLYKSNKPRQAGNEPSVFHWSLGFQCNEAIIQNDCSALAVTQLLLTCWRRKRSRESVGRVYPQIHSAQTRWDHSCAANQEVYTSSDWQAINRVIRGTHRLEITGPHTGHTEALASSQN